jgi:hypothetical protein
MKNPDEKLITEEGFELKFNLRETVDISLKIPKDVLASLEKVAQKREMSVQALVKFYIGQNLRQDLAKMFSDKVLERTEVVLSRHLKSQEVSEILREIKVDLAA